MNRYYHGTTITDLDELDVEKCAECSPFGKAIYLTKDPAVADCYTGISGWIFEVEIVGDWNYAINFDLPFFQQTENVKIAISKYRCVKPKDIDPTSNVRYLIHENVLSKEKANRFLSDCGVWMLYGKLDPMESSGLMDRGVQYAVLNNSNVSIIRARYFNEIYEELDS